MNNSNKSVYDSTNLVSEIKIYNEYDSDVCLAGFNYHQSDESFLTKHKKKVKKLQSNSIHRKYTTNWKNISI